MWPENMSYQAWSYGFLGGMGLLLGTFVVLALAWHCCFSPEASARNQGLTDGVLVLHTAEDDV